MLLVGVVRFEIAKDCGSSRPSEAGFAHQAAAFVAHQRDRLALETEIGSCLRNEREPAPALVDDANKFRAGRRRLACETPTSEAGGLAHVGDQRPSFSAKTGLLEQSASFATRRRRRAWRLIESD
jgi:hypothetical protein